MELQLALQAQLQLGLKKYFENKEWDGIKDDNIFLQKLNEIVDEFINYEYIRNSSQ